MQNQIMKEDMPSADKDEEVCDTPQILMDVGCDKLPMLYTQQHLKDALHKKSENNSHWHGLTIEQIKVSLIYLQIE